MNSTVDLLREIYDGYLQALKECETKYKPTDGVLGFGHSIKDDPCHGQFDAGIGKVIDEAVSADPSSEEAEAAIRFLFSHDPARYPVSAGLMLCAAERYSLKLIPFLSKEAAQALFREYDRKYKRWERLPVQREVWKALKSGS
ncbi:MAG: hypothetical protein Q4G19_01965 [Clostridia bacterium]|nr:hypothetical protein [Clostridia bacterium]